MLVNQRIDYSELKQEGVYKAVAVAGEHQGKYKEGVSRNGRRIETKCDKCADLRGKLVYTPCKEEAEQVSHRAGDSGKDNGVSHSDKEYFIVKYKSRIVFKSDKIRPLEHIEVGKAEKHGNRNGKHGEYCEKNYIRRAHEITDAVVPYSHEFLLAGQFLAIFPRLPFKKLHKNFSPSL